MRRQHTVEIHLAPVVFQRFRRVAQDGSRERAAQRVGRRQVDRLDAGAVFPVVLLAPEYQRDGFARQVRVGGARRGDDRERQVGRRGGQGKGQPERQQGQDRRHAARQNRRLSEDMKPSGASMVLCVAPFHSAFNTIAGVTR